VRTLKSFVLIACHGTAAHRLYCVNVDLFVMIAGCISSTVMNIIIYNSFVETIKMKSDRRYDTNHTLAVSIDEVAVVFETSSKSIDILSLTIFKDFSSLLISS